MKEIGNGEQQTFISIKKEATTLLQRAGHQLSGTLIPHDGFYHNIRENNSPVKPKLNNVTETQQFRKWFGDWMKHPNKASKVVNSDGAPLYAALGFYSDNRINDVFSRKPHVVLTISEREMAGNGGFLGHLEVINNTVASGNILSFDKEKMRDYMTVIANLTRVGDVSSKSLNNNVARFREFVNDFRKRNNINYKTAVVEDLSPRELLVRTVEGMVANSAEWEQPQKYRKKIICRTSGNTIKSLWEYPTGFCY